MTSPVMPSGFQVISAFPACAGPFVGSVGVAAGDLSEQSFRAATGLREPISREGSRRSSWTGDAC
jgi:hypothetical protein